MKKNIADERIDDRSPGVRNIIGQDPPRLVAYGTVAVILLFLIAAVVLACVHTSDGTQFIHRLLG